MLHPLCGGGGVNKWYDWYVMSGGGGRGGGGGEGERVAHELVNNIPPDEMTTSTR